jgi:hypothetical protein
VILRDLPVVRGRAASVDDATTALFIEIALARNYRRGLAAEARKGGDGHDIRRGGAAEAALEEWDEYVESLTSTLRALAAAATRQGGSEFGTSVTTRTPRAEAEVSETGMVDTTPQVVGAAAEAPAGAAATVVARAPTPVDVTAASPSAASATVGTGLC